MKKALLLVLSVLVLGSVSHADVLTFEPLDHDGIMVKVDVFKAIEKVTAMKAETVDEYVVTLNRPKTGALYADATEGVSDAPVVAYSNKLQVGIFQAVGDSIAKNPWKWAIGTGAAVFGVYKIGDSYGWWDRGESGGSSYTIPPIETGDDSPVIIIINNDQSHTDYDAPITSETEKE
jgi:hypothetical protein